MVTSSTETPLSPFCLLSPTAIELPPVKVELPVDAHLPHDYIPGERLRLEAYRRIAAASDEQAVLAVREELRDRYGVPPVEVDNLFAVAAFRVHARKYGITDAHSPDAIVEAVRLGTSVAEKDIRGRTDFRQIPTVTIDGEHARDFDDAVHVAATAQYVEQRARTHRALRAQGADVLDVTCRELPGALVEHYLAVKRAARL